MLAACAAPPATTHPLASSLTQAESAYADLRTLRDRYDVVSAAGMTKTPAGMPLTELAHRHDGLRTTVLEQLTAIDSTTLPADDARALGVMRATIVRDITPIGDTSATGAADARPDCAIDAASIVRARGGLDSLRRRMYDCYGWAQHHVVVGDDTLDRLTVLGSIGRNSDRGGSAATLSLARARLAEHERG